MTTFGFIVDGQPPSWNQSYRIERRGYVNTLVKAVGLEEYQARVERVCAKALPPGWKPLVDYDPKQGTGLIAIEYRFFLKRDIDCDNMMKAINDAIALGLGSKVVISRAGKPRRVPIYDDKRFLPRAMTKITGLRVPHLEITVDG